VRSRFGLGAVSLRADGAAAARLRPILESANLKNLWVSLISNVDASPIGTSTAVRNALLRQVASPLRWLESVQRMVAMGGRRVVEVGRAMC